MQVPKFILLFVLILLGCSGKLHRKPYISHDPAFELFVQGRELLQQKELIQAEIYFSKALDLRPNFAPALDGLAQVYLAQNHQEMAEQYAQLALRGSPKWLPARLTETRILIRRSEYELAEQKLQSLKKIVFKRHLKLLKVPVLYYSALVKFKQNDFNKAQAELEQLLKFQPKEPKAIQLLQEVRQKNIMYKNIPKDIRPFVFKTMITRDDLAVLIDRLFNSQKFRYSLPNFISDFYPIVPFKKLKDVDMKSKASVSIERVLKNKIMWAFPNFEFRPAHPVARGAFTLVLERIFLRFTADSLQIKLPAQTYRSRFVDVPRESFIYHAVCFTLQNDLLKINGNQFNPKGRVSGEEAVFALQKLGELIKRSSFPTNFNRHKKEDAKHN